MSASDTTGFNPSMRIESTILTDKATVVVRFELGPDTDLSYQSEAALEKGFIIQLHRQAYEYVVFNSEVVMITDLRTQLETLNHYAFTDSKWGRFSAEEISGHNDGTIEKTRCIQKGHIQVLLRNTGEAKNIRLIDKKRIHNGRLQVTNQYVVEPGAHDNRYSVTILINRLPLVHVELKRRGVALKETFKQINHYQWGSF